MLTEAYSLCLNSLQNVDFLFRQFANPSNLWIGILQVCIGFDGLTEVSTIGIVSFSVISHPKSFTGIGLLTPASLGFNSKSNLEVSCREDRLLFCQVSSRGEGQN